MGMATLLRDVLLCPLFDGDVLAFGQTAFGQTFAECGDRANGILR